MGRCRAGNALHATVTCFGNHCSQQLADNRTPLPHLALPGIGQVRYDSNDVTGTARFCRIGNDEQLHDVVVDVPARFRKQWMQTLT